MSCGIQFAAHCPCTSSPAKAGSVVGSIALLLQLHLPGPWSALPLILLGVATPALMAGCAYGACQSTTIAQGFARARKKQARLGGLRAAEAILFSTTVLVGGNGEQILDEVTNYRIDKDLAGGKKGAATIKTAISAIAGMTTLFIGWRNYRRRFLQPGGARQRPVPKARPKPGVWLNSVVHHEVSVALWMVCLGCIPGSPCCCLGMGPLGL